jgi:hypothetical protein
MSRTATAACVVVLLILSSCGGDADDSAPAVAVNPAFEEPFDEVNSAGHQIIVDWTIPRPQLPFDRFVLMHFSYAGDLVDNAVDRLVERCMQGKGLEFEFPPRPIRDVASINLRRYGPIEMAVVEAYGYGPPPSPVEFQMLQETEAQSTSPEIQEALTGPVGQELDPSTMGTNPGCMFEAGRQLNGGIGTGEAFGTVQGMAAGTLHAALTDPEVQNAMGRWRDCLGAAGFPTDAASPLALSAASIREGPDPLPGEVETAVADIRCKRESGLVETWAVSEARVQADLYSNNLELFDRARVEQLALIESAAAELGVEVSAEFLEVVG